MRGARWLCSRRRRLPLPRDGSTGCRRLSRSWRWGARPTRTSALPWIARPGEATFATRSRSPSPGPLVAISSGPRRGSAIRRRARWPEEAVPLLRLLRDGTLTTAILAELKQAFPSDWQEHLGDAQVSEQYFYVLLWRSQPAPARDYALRMADRFKTLSLQAAGWVERAGDAAFFGKDIQGAKLSYDEALRLDETERTRYWSIVLKLCDVAFVSGDLATERSLREQYYGSLEEARP